MKRTLLLETLVILLVLSVFTVLFVGCSGNSEKKKEETNSTITESVSVQEETTSLNVEPTSELVEETASSNTEQTSEAAEETESSMTQTEENSVKEEVNGWKEVKQNMDDEAYKLTSKVEEKNSMDPELFKNLVELQDEFDRYRELSKKDLSSEAYTELFYCLSDEGYWQPITYANTSFYLSSEYYVQACWSDNVNVPENNNSYDSDRVYTLKDNTKPGYLLLSPTETNKRLVVIEPGDTYTHKFRV